MQEYAASVTGVFRTLLIIIGLYFAVRILGRLLKPLMSGQRTSQMKGQQHSDGRREGEVRIEYPDQKDRTTTRQGKGKSGEYIDFEEVD